MPRYHKSRAVLPSGKYQVKVIGAKDEISKNGNPMITLRLSVKVKGASRVFFDHLVFTDSSDWKVAEFLTAMGEELTDEMDIKPYEYVDRTALARVGIKEFEGQLQNFIERWLPPESSAGKATEAPSSTVPTSGAMGDQVAASNENEGSAR
jgi:Protein of unknown function (DUF669)